MNQHLKWVTIQKIDRIILQLASETELSSKISDIHSVSTWNFADFRTTILRFCQNIMDTARIQQLSTESSNKADDTTAMSANATTITMDKTEYDALTSTPFNGRVRSSSPYQQKREPMRVAFSQQHSERSGRERSRSRDTEYSRDRSNHHDRSTSRDRRLSSQRDGFASYGRQYNNRDRDQSPYGRRKFNNRGDRDYRQPSRDRSERSDRRGNGRY